jgi:hypothetical protein
LSFFARIIADRIKHAAFVRMIGHSDRMSPKAVQRMKPVTVRQYILAEMASVSPVRMTFQTCGMKLQTEQTEARYPTMSAVSKISISY